MKAHRFSSLLALWVVAVMSSAPMVLDARQAKGQGPETMGRKMMGHGMGGPGMGGPGMRGPGMTGQNWGSAPRHRQFMTSGVPEPYASMQDPLPQSPEVVALGRTVFEENCASCHGAHGLGNGEAGRDLSPPPSNLAAVMGMPMMRSATYLYWATAEGGEPIGTAMPAFKDTLSADEIWSVVHFLEAGLPEAGGSEAK